MKNILLLLLMLVSTNGISESKLLEPTSYFRYGNHIKDGWYEATVKYYNYNTSYMATYTLNVQVEDDRVVKISFGNGGSVHNGYNNEGYYYSGGDLDYYTDYDGNITSAETTVTVRDDDGTKTFGITIE